MPKVTPSLLLLAALAGPALRAADADRPWQHLTNPTAVEAATGFAQPPPEYSPTVTWGWNGPMSEEVITRDLDALHALGFRAATIEAGYHMDNAPYLTDGWFKLVRFAAEQARDRGMRLWIIDEGKYPSGFAGGLFTRERPDLRMQGIAIAEKVPVAAGQTVTRTPAPEVVGVLAVNEENGESRLLAPSAGVVSFTAPATGRWAMLVVDHQFRTGDTRAVNDPTQAKTKANSMGDLLNPVAVDQFIAWTHEGYRKHLGDLFGTAVLGFRGDEPDFANTPWNAGIVDEFQKRKGYDVRPYLAYTVSLAPNAAGPKLTEEQRRAKADYWDVWSDLFAKNFFQRQGDWCRAQGIEYMVHINQDHDLLANVRSEGDYFQDMRSVSIPGIDVIWSQIYPGRGPADFPKFASSATHVYGHPRALSESFAAFRDPLTLDVARWVVNQEMVRGISLFEFMFYMSSAGNNAAPATRPSGNGARGYMADPAFPALAAYTHRAQFLLATGRPAAQIAVYAPSTSFWLGDREADASIIKISQVLTEAQRDFDYVDEAALASVMTLEKGAFKNLSGQSYRAVIIPSVIAISRAALDRLRAFARGGGIVISLGRTPALVNGRTFLHAGGPEAMDWAVREPSGDLTPAVFAALPPPDVSLDQPNTGLKVNHRRLRDADVYFLFNEGQEALTRTLTLAGEGAAQVWDAGTGQVSAVAGVEKTGGGMKLPLTLAASEARFIVLGTKLPAIQP